MKKKLHIVCDLDSTIVDLFGLWLTKYNDLYNDNLTPAEVLSFDIHLYTKPECGEKIYDLLDEDFFLNVKPYDGAIEAVEYLHNQGHRIHVATAFSTDKPYTAATKTVWVRKHMPFVHKRFITLSSQKHLLAGNVDVLVDDRPDTAKNVRKVRNGNNLFLATMAFPFNEQDKDFFNVYAQSYKNPRQAWQTIVTAIEELAES